MQYDFVFPSPGKNPVVSVEGRERRFRDGCVKQGTLPTWFISFLQGETKSKIPQQFERKTKYKPCCTTFPNGKNLHLDSPRQVEGMVHEIARQQHVRFGFRSTSGHDKRRWTARRSTPSFAKREHRDMSTIGGPELMWFSTEVIVHVLDPCSNAFCGDVEHTEFQFPAPYVKSVLNFSTVCAPTAQETAVVLSCDI